MKKIKILSSQGRTEAVRQIHQNIIWQIKTKQSVIETSNRWNRHNYQARCSIC